MLGTDKQLDLTTLNLIVLKSALSQTQSIFLGFDFSVHAEGNSAMDWHSFQGKWTNF